MTVSLKLNVSRSDIAAFNTQMNRARKQLGYSLGKAVRLKAWAISDSLRTATKVAPKTRPITATGRVSVTGKQEFEVTAIRGNVTKKYNVYASGIREAKKSPFVQIGRRGLAAQAWGHAQSKLGRSSSVGASSQTKGVAKGYSRVLSKLKGDNPSVTITNSIPYATEAFKGSGPQVVANVMERASGRMMHIIDGQIKKQFGAK